MEEKEFDIREIYVAIVVNQTQVRTEVVDPTDWLSDENWVWEYETLNIDNMPKKLFIKTLTGYKHILTDTIYKKSSHKTGGQIVIDRNNIYEFTKACPDITRFLLNNNKYKVSITVSDKLPFVSVGEEITIGYYNEKDIIEIKKLY